MIETIKDIQLLLVADKGRDWGQYGNVSAKHKNNLTLFNYTAAATFERRWNFFERTSRGLIINNQTGEIIARPFDKFFNWGEGERITDASILSVTEKMDGSLGILYRHNGQFKIATRGSFDSDQALWATKHLNERYDLKSFDLDYDYLTLLFEIIYPENRVVVDYGRHKGLTLLAARDRFDGFYLSHPCLVDMGECFGFSVVNQCDFSDPAELLKAKKTLPPNNEGWVVEFSDRQRFKFKGDEYLRLHRLVSSLSFKNTLAAFVDGNVQEIIDTVPDEFLDDVKSWINEIQETTYDITKQVTEAFKDAPTSDRKTFAMWVTTEHQDMASYLFAMLDGRDITPMIYKTAFKNREQQC